MAEVKRAAGPLTRLASTVRLVGVAVLAGLLLLAAPVCARADGDPASDVLTEQPVFFGSALDLKSKPAAQLDALVKEAKAKGFPVNPVVISRLEDMGSATYLYDDPESYADFLTGEIGCCVKGWILIVMPGGLGVNHVGHSSRADRAVVGTLAPPRRVPNLLPAAISGVVKLAAAHGVILTVPDVPAAPNGVDQPITHASAPNVGAAGGRAAKGSGGSALFLLPVALLAVLALALIVRRRLAARGSAGEPAAVDREHDPVDVVRRG